MNIRQMQQHQDIEKLKQKEQQAIAKHRAAEARLGDDERKKRTRAFLCAGVLVDRLMKIDPGFLEYLISSTKSEKLHNRIGLGAYWSQSFLSKRQRTSIVPKHIW